MGKTYIDTINNEAREAVMRLYGEIGPKGKIDGDLFAQELASLDGQGFDLVRIRVNSPGGDVLQGMSIVSALFSMQTPVIMHVDGVAASITAVIVEAGDEVLMMDFAKMMIHEAYYPGIDTDKIPPKMRKAQARLNDMMRQVLSRRGKSPDQIAKLMQEETWFSAEEAKAAGLCDTITSSTKLVAYKNMEPLQLVAAINAEYEQTNPNKPITHKTMKTVASKLGLPETASEAEVLAAVAKLDQTHDTEVSKLKAEKEAAEAEVALMKKEKEEAETAEAVALVDAAVKAGSISAELKTDYLEMFKADFDRTKKILGGAAPRAKLGDMAGKLGGSTSAYAAMSWDELDKKNLLATLREQDPDLYEAKYKEMAATLKISRQ